MAILWAFERDSYHEKIMAKTFSSIQSDIIFVFLCKFLCSPVLLLSHRYPLSVTFRESPNLERFHGKLTISYHMIFKVELRICVFSRPSGVNDIFTSPSMLFQQSKSTCNDVGEKNTSENIVLKFL